MWCMLRALQRLAWQATTTEVTNTDHRPEPGAQVTSSLEPLDHAAEVHQAPSNFKRLRDHGQEDAFQKTFHMNFPWVKAGFV